MHAKRPLKLNHLSKRKATRLFKSYRQVVRTVAMEFLRSEYLADVVMESVFLSVKENYTSLNDVQQLKNFITDKAGDLILAHLKIMADQYSSSLRSSQDKDGTDG